MSFSHTITQTYTVPGGQIAYATSTETADSEHNFDGVLAGSASPGTESEVDWAITVANLKSIVMSSDIDVTVRTNVNHTGSPQETIALAGSQALMWNTHSASAVPFLGNVTKLYVTVISPTSASATFKVRALLDQTP